MTTEIVAIVAGTEYSLTDEDPFGVESVEMWGMAPGHLLESRGAEQHGTTVEGFRLDPRDLELIIGYSGEDSDLRIARELLLSIFQRRTDPILVRFTFDDGTVRQIDGHLASGLGFGRDGRDHNHQRAAAVLRCGDPTFYDPTAQAVTFALGGAAGAETAVPTSVPTSVGASTIDTSTPVTYGGTWRSQPVIRIVGPITEFVLTNETTGDDITARAGVTIAAGDYYEIDCRYGAATVTDSLGANKIANISDSSELTTFAFLPDPDAADGINVLSLSGTAVDSNTVVYVTYFVRYLGA